MYSSVTRLSLISQSSIYPASSRLSKFADHTQWFCDAELEDRAVITASKVCNSE
jgi:hypothetical protein